MVNASAVRTAFNSSVAFGRFSRLSGHTGGISMSMSEETRRETDQLREEIRSIGAALRQLREDLSGVDRIKTGILRVWRTP